jgi:RimJ/RimL family protein N-acetyltransferase
MSIGLSRVEEVNQIGQPIEEWGEYHKTNGIAATVVDPEGQIVFCLGVHHRWSGFGELWAIYSPLAKKYANTLKVTKMLLRCLDHQFGYHRLQAAIDPRFPETVRFIEHLGLKREFLMRRYGPHGEDRVLYALVKENKNAG